MSLHKKSSSVEGIVTSDAVHGKKLLAKKLWLISTGLVIIFVLIAAVIVYRQYIYKPKTQTTVQNRISPHAQQAINSAQTELKSAHTPSDKATAYSNLGLAYLGNDQGTKAITAFQNSVTADSSDQLGSLIGLGYAYNEISQNQKAISAFQQVVNLLQQSTNPEEQGKIPEFQNIVKQLQAGNSI
jgi:tetratricopeptide (TPR) repeat protein